MKLIALVVIFSCLLSFASSRVAEKKVEKHAHQAEKHAQPANILKKFTGMGKKLGEKAIDQLQTKMHLLNKVNKRGAHAIDEAKSLILREMTKIGKEKKGAAVEKRDYYYNYYGSDHHYYGSDESLWEYWDYDDEGWWSDLLQFWDYVGSILHSIENGDFDMDNSYKKLLMEELFKLKKVSAKAVKESETVSDYETYETYETYDSDWWEEFWAYWESEFESGDESGDVSDSYSESESESDSGSGSYSESESESEYSAYVSGSGSGSMGPAGFGPGFGSGSIGPGSGPGSSSGPGSGPGSSGGPGSGPGSSMGPGSGPGSSGGPGSDSSVGPGPRAVDLKVTREELEYLEKALKKRLGQMRKK